ncbi:molybdenum cofactor guanylyltransferase [bacterium]|nr:MAG: molybdenum cofactor guanylyltransferase [bacterium]RIK63042.1 MAG: hypothetical protein DCC64_08220 [Planctomycetota bacterium]
MAAPFSFPMKRQDTLGLVLAGGLATRMQGEKALRMLRGRTLLEHASELLRPHCGAVAVSTGARRLDLPSGLTALPDLPPYVQQGPLAGIHAGLVHAARRHERLLVLACDLPLIPPALLELLVEKLDAADVVFCEHGGQPEPLVCALRTAAMIGPVEGALAAGRLKVVPLWRAARCEVLTDAQLAAFAPLDRAFANVNTLADLEMLERPEA